MIPVLHFRLLAFVTALMCVADVSAQVVIRERVEVRPRAALGPSPGMTTADGPALCGEPVVGTVRYVPERGPSQAIYFYDGSPVTA